MSQAVTSSILARIKGLAKIWRDLGGGGHGSEMLSFAPDLPDEDKARLRQQMQACLDGEGGEVSARLRAAAMGREYLSLSPEGRRRFLTLMAEEFGPNRDDVDQALAKVQTAGEDKIARAKAERALRHALQPASMDLLTQFNALPEGVKFLVDMRAELAGMTKGDAALSGLEADLKELLSAWFDVGFLELRRITWRSSASVLEKIMQYEAVHAIKDWTDLKNRLDDGDRRLYGFFHPRMPEEPLIFVQVALVKGIADNIADLLDTSAPTGNAAGADTAIFYSISNAQKGLNGISFGNFLIKRVVQELSAEFKNIRTYCTLSPVPGFRAWLDPILDRGEPGLLTATENKALAPYAKDGLRALLDDPAWPNDPARAEALRPAMTRLVARYLVQEKKSGRALDPVAHFHLSNGARLERINWLGDTSPKGLKQSASLMVNYLYKLDEIEANHETYADTGTVVASNPVRSLAK